MAVPTVSMSVHMARLIMLKKSSEQAAKTSLRRVAQVNEAICQGCGACTVVCPSGAMDLKGFTNQQIMAEVDAICR